jgi:poly(3-hydroxybutyrate) depolymerase
VRCSLTSTLASAREPRRPETILVGLSNGATFAERLARSGAVAAAAVALVCGTAREASHRRLPVPRQRAAVLVVAGTADPLVPYAGGPLSADPLAVMVGHADGRVLTVAGHRRPGYPSRAVCYDCADRWGS